MQNAKLENINPLIRISKILDTGKDKEIQMALLVAALKDVEKLNINFNLGHEFFLVLQKLIHSHSIEQIEITSGMQKLTQHSTLSCKKLVTMPSREHSVNTIKVLQGVRALLFAYHFVGEFAFKKNLLEILSALFKGNNKQTFGYAADLSLDRDNLIQLQNKFSVDHKLYQFISNILLALNFIEHKQNYEKLQGNNLEINLSLSNHEVGRKEIQSEQEGEVEKSGDLMRYHLSQLTFLNRKEFSGVLNLYQHFHPLELAPIIQKAFKQFRETQNEVAFAFLVCFFLRVHVSRFQMIPLKYEAGKNIWIEMEHGYLCWNRQALLKADRGVEAIRIPLPIEIVKEFQARSGLASTNLDSCFKMDLKQLKKEVRKYTYTITNSSHKPFLTRLYWAYGRFVLDICQDENYAAAITTDFSLGTIANFSYMVVKPEKINSICQKVYSELGLSGRFLKSAENVVGSIMGQNYMQIAELINHHLLISKSAYLTIHKKSSFEELANVHNKIITGLMLILVGTLGLRKAKEYSITNHTIDLGRGLALVSDKASTKFLTSRLIPFPLITENWLHFYKNWLKSLTNRTQSINRKLYLEMATINGLRCEEGEIPLFFYFNNNQIKKIGSRHLNLVLEKSGLEANFGRHFLDINLREDVSNVLLNVLSGRANLGQEFFGMRSAISVNWALNTLKNSINQKLAKFNFESPPIFNELRTNTRLAQIKYQALPWSKLSKEQSKNIDFDERCPFDEHTLINSQLFERISKAWFSKAIELSVGELVLSLIIADGILVEEELKYVLNEICIGKIYYIDKQYFVDVNTPALGIRRLYLSTISICIASKINYLSMNDGIGFIKIANQSVQVLLALIAPANEKRGIKFLLGIAQDYYATHVSGLLREWMCGRQHARTLRPEAVARQVSFQMERLDSISKHKITSTKIRSNQVFIKMIGDATHKDKKLGSNALRMSNFCDGLKLLVGGFVKLEDNLSAHYLHFLASSCPQIQSPSTVKNYFYAIKPVIQQVANAIDHVDEIQNLNWSEIANQFSEMHQDQQSLSSLNYFLKCFGLPTFENLKKDEARASRTYADFPSNSEIEWANQIIESMFALSPHQKDSRLMLKVMAEVPLRPEDITHLRTQDFQWEGEPHIVITSSANGTKKSENANRVLFISSTTASELARLSAIRLQLALDQKNLSFFGTSEFKNDFTGADDLLNIVEKALKFATGSKYVSPHSLRGKYLTENFFEVLRPSVLPSHSLNQRNSLYQLSISAGHADVDVTVKNYVCDLEKLRREWVDHLILSSVRVKPAFLESLLSLSSETAKKRVQRGFEINDLKNEINLMSNIGLSNRLVDLATQLSDRIKIPSLDHLHDEADELVSISSYIYLKFLGVEQEAAAYASLIESHKMELIEGHLQNVIHMKGADFFVGQFKNQSIIDKLEIFVKLRQFFGNWSLNSKEYANFFRLLPRNFNEEWSLNNNDLAFVGAEFQKRLSQAGYAVIVKIPIQNDQKMQESIDQIRTNGIARIEKTNRRQFESRDELRLYFKDINHEVMSQFKPYELLYLLNTFILSFLIFQKIKNTHLGVL